MQLLTKASRKRSRNPKSQTNTMIHRPVLINFNESKRTRKGCSRERPKDIIMDHRGRKYRDEIIGKLMGAETTTDDAPRTFKILQERIIAMPGINRSAS